MTSDPRADVEARLADLLGRHDPGADPAAFAGAQYDLGLAWVHFPVGRGGLGAPRYLQATVNDAVERAGGPAAHRINPIGRGMAAPTLLAHGSADQLDRYLRPLFTGEDMWCQLFSEPGAGSDVAGLATSAVRDGDDWVVTGQKVWTSLAHLARWGLLLARTDPDVPKHAGLTYFVVDMQAPGVDVRPLRQATGDAEFNEVYLTGVRVPDAERLDDVGAGWRVALTTLMNERTAIGRRDLARGSGAIGAALDLWARRLGDDPAQRDRLVELWARAEVLRLTNLRASEAASTRTPGPEGSIGKLFGAELNREVFDLCVSIAGAEGMLYDDYEERRSDASALTELPVTRALLRAQANTIEGGTSDVLRNILAERVLGLPKEPRYDRDVPWRLVPR